MVRLALKSRKKPTAEKGDAPPGTDTTGRSADSQRNPLGISAEGDALRGIGLQSAALVAVPLLMVILILSLWQAPRQRDALLDAFGEHYSQQQAEHLNAALASFTARLVAAGSGVMQSGIDLQSSPEHLDDAEARLRSYFPEALSVRLFPLGELGVATVDEELQLRNHIEFDLLRRAANEEPPQPEAYQVQGRWIASMAARIEITGNDGSPVVGVALLTVDENTLRRLLGEHDALSGRLTLRQRVSAGETSRDIDVITVGRASSARDYAADVTRSPWQVVFQPSQALEATVNQTNRPPYEMLLLCLLVSLAALFLVVRRGHATLEREVQRIAAAAGTRNNLTLRVPELLPLARELRKLALRRTRSPATSTPGASNPAEGTTRPASAGTDSIDPSGPSAAALPATLFRAYDIRGIADSQLDDETVARIGGAVATLAGELGEQTLVIGCDGRLSSKRIKDVLQRALLRAGRDVVDIGLVPTPLLYFATQRGDCSSGIMVTGSHNPPDYNGMKIVLQSCTVAEGTIEKIRDLAQAGTFSTGNGRLLQRDVVGDYLDEIVNDIAIAVPLKIVLDAGNGATSHVAPAMLEELGCEVLPLFCEIDGHFPNRSPDTSNEDNLQQLVDEVLAKKADFGVAFDGDGDRLVVVTGSGRILRTDTLMMLLARDVVARNPGADVVYDIKCSRNLAQVISGLGGRPVLWKTGHALMRQKVRETGAPLGGEFSGHIFFGERWYGFDDAMYASARLAEILASQGSSLDEMIADLPVAVSTPELFVPISEEAKFPLIERFVAEARFPEAKINTLDGLRADFSDGWGLLRASNTSPALTARFEGNDDAALERIRTLFREQLAAIAPDLDAAL